MAEIENGWPDDLRRRLHTDVGDYRIYGIWRKTFLTGLFDPLWQFLDPSRAAVDVGALLGQYSLTLAASSTRLLCVEPLQQYGSIAQALPSNCLWRTVAAGAERGVGVLRSPVFNDGSVGFGLSSFRDQAWTNSSTVLEQETEIQPLDDLIPDALGTEPIGFIKIDVEGFELDVLRGAEATLGLHRPRLLIETADPVAIDSAMRALGYSGFFFFRRRLHDLADFRAELHMASEHRWSPERHESFDPDLIMSDLYFLPVGENPPVPVAAPLF